MRPARRSSPTYGIVEITPEREYLLVTEFLDGAKEIGDAEVTIDDALIDEALRAVRALWNAGVAHRDVKPANVMVHEGHIVLIDVAFAQIRPSAWREAVDLANMMLVLALKTDAYRVYRRGMPVLHARRGCGGVRSDARRHDPDATARIDACGRP